MKTIKKTQLLLFALVAVVPVVIIVYFFVSVAAIFFQGARPSQLNSEITQEDFDNIIAVRDSWEEFSFERFSMRLPNYELLQNEEDVIEFIVTDPTTNNSARFLITIESASVDTINSLESEEFGVTKINEYTALRTGSDEPPYDTVTYYILENEVLYTIDVSFTTPPVFLDQILSTFTIQ